MTDQGWSVLDLPSLVQLTPSAVSVIVELLLLFGARVWATLSGERSQPG
jgi:hypothetical protein